MFILAESQSRIFASGRGFEANQTWVAGVELATANEPPARKPRIGAVAFPTSSPAIPASLKE